MIFSPIKTVVWGGMFLLVLAICLVWSVYRSGGVAHVRTKQRVVALTFDDGPQSPNTEELLNVLGEKQVRVTFFMVGEQVQAHSELAQQVAEAGHEIGGHGMGWSHWAFLSQKQIQRQVQRMLTSFAAAGLPETTLLRAPMGIVMPWQVAWIEQQGVSLISADVLGFDWKTQDSEQIERSVLLKVKPGSIIALHDGGGDRSGTVLAVAEIIDALRENGYVFVSVSELLALQE